MASNGATTRAIRKRRIQNECKIKELQTEFWEENSDNTLVSEPIALLSALSIPEHTCSSSHDEFLNKYATKSKTLTKSDVDKIQKIYKERTRSLRKSQENPPNIPEPVIKMAITEKQKKEKEDGVISDDNNFKITPALKAAVLEGSPAKDNSSKPKPKHKHWFEDDVPIVERLGRHKLEINGKLVVINYNQYAKNDSIVFEYDADESNAPPLPGYEKPCKKDFCRLGCICKSIAECGIKRERCEIPTCMFGCLCFPSTNIENDGGIRSRLRPRVTLLNWRYPDRNEKSMEKCSPISLKGKRAAQRPSKLNEYVTERRKGPRKRNARNYPLSPTKANKRAEPTRLTKPLKRYGGGRRTKEQNVASPQPSIAENIASVVKEYENTIASYHTANDDPVRYEEEFPTLLYQPIGTSHDIEDKQYLESGDRAINTYGTLQRELKSFPVKEKLQRQNGKIVTVYWTATKMFPKLLNATPDGDNLMLPILPENSQWLIYEFPENYMDSPHISFDDIGLIVSSKVFKFQKTVADSNNKIVKLKLAHHENRNALSTMSLYLLPRNTDLVVLGPVKQNICKTTDPASPPLLSYEKTIDGLNFFGSEQMWDFASDFNQERMAEPFHVYVQRERERDADALTNEVVPPEVMAEIIPELMETYEEDEIPTSLHQTNFNGHGRGNVMRLTWSDSFKCSANVNPEMIWQDAILVAHENDSMMNDASTTSS